MTPPTPQEKTVEGGNRIIAEFMGYINYEAFEGHWMWQRQPGDAISFRELTFDKNWSELMPVVEKIADTPMEDFIDEKTEDGGYAYPVTFGMRSEIGEWMVRFRGHGLHKGDTLIAAAWEAVVDFIEWYNQQSSKG